MPTNVKEKLVELIILVPASEAAEMKALARKRKYKVTTSINKTPAVVTHKLAGLVVSDNPTDPEGLERGTRKPGDLPGDALGIWATPKSSQQTNADIRKKAIKEADEFRKSAWERAK